MLARRAKKVLLVTLSALVLMWLFAGASFAGSSDNKFDVHVIASPNSATERTGSVLVGPGGSVSVNPPPANLNLRTVLTLTATPKVGHLFLGWYEVTNIERYPYVKETLLSTSLVYKYTTNGYTIIEGRFK